MFWRESKKKIKKKQKKALTFPNKAAILNEYFLRGDKKMSNLVNFSKILEKSIDLKSYI